MRRNQSNQRRGQKILNSIARHKGVLAVSAAAAALYPAQYAKAAPPDGTVTFVISMNDDGFGDFTPNSFAIYAIDGTVTGTTVTPNTVAVNGNKVDGGIDNYNLVVTGAVAGTLNDDIANGSTFAAYAGAGSLFAPTYYNLTDAAKTSHKDSNVEAGFTSNTLSNDNNSTTVGAGQDTVGKPPSLAKVLARTNATLIIFGLGQSAGDMLNFATATTGNNPGTPTSTTVDSIPPYSSPYAGPGTFTYGGNTYLKSLLVADGQYVTGVPPTINTTASTVGLLAAYDESFDTNASGYDGAGSSTVVAALTQTLTDSAPEPGSLGLISAGAVGLLARRRRRAKA